MLNVFLTNPNNTDEVWEMPTDEVKWTEEKNAIKSGQFSVNFLSLKELANKIGTSVKYIIKGGPRKLLISDSIYKDDPVLFTGWTRDYQFCSSASEPTTISLNFADLGVRLSKRVGQDYAFYDQVNQETIFKTELDRAQGLSNGDMGLSIRSLLTTVKRQRTVKRTNLLDLVTGMSHKKASDGFDFEVNKLGEIVTSTTQGVIRENIVLDSMTAQQPQINGKLVGNLANRVLVQGGELKNAEGETTQEAMQVTVEDVGSQEIWGLHEEYISATDIATEPFLRARGQQILNERAWPTNTESFSMNHLGDDPDWRSYSVGDWLRVDLPEYELNEFLRVVKRSIAYKNGVYQIGLSMNREAVPNG